MPGTRLTSATALRVLSGSSRICCIWMTVVTELRSVCSSDVPPSTETSSVTAPTSSTGETRRRSPTVSSTRSTFQVLNPDSDAVTEYQPIGSARISKLPLSSETAVCVRPVARFVTVTVAPGRTPLDASVTSPRMEAWVPT